jgi:hypothetical protein
MSNVTTITIPGEDLGDVVRYLADWLETEIDEACSYLDLRRREAIEHLGEEYDGFDADFLASLIQYATYPRGGGS